MSPVTAWTLWFGAQIIVFVALMAVAVLGVTGRLTHASPAERRARHDARPHHLHLPFWHHAAH